MMRRSLFAFMAFGSYYQSEQDKNNAADGD